MYTCFCECFSWLTACEFSDCAGYFCPPISDERCSCPVFLVVEIRSVTSNIFCTFFVCSSVLFIDCIDDSLHFRVIWIDTCCPTGQANSFAVNIDKIHRCTLDSTVNAFAPSMMLCHESWRGHEAIRRFANPVLPLLKSSEISQCDMGERRTLN